MFDSLSQILGNVMSSNCDFNYVLNNCFKKKNIFGNDYLLLLIICFQTSIWFGQ